MLRPKLRQLSPLGPSGSFHCMIRPRASFAADCGPGGPFTHNGRRDSRTTQQKGVSRFRALNCVGGASSARPISNMGAAVHDRSKASARKGNPASSPYRRGSPWTKLKPRGSPHAEVSNNPACIPRPSCAVTNRSHPITLPSPPLLVRSRAGTRNFHQESYGRDLIRIRPRIRPQGPCSVHTEW